MDEKIMEELKGETVDVSLGEVDGLDDLSYEELEDIDADPKWNIRRLDKYDERIARKVEELKNDKVIRVPMVLFKIDEEPLRMTIGFLRYGALCRIRDEDPELYDECFRGQVPYRIINGTEDQRERFMLDHGSEEVLDEYEILMTVERYVNRGCTEKEIAVMISPLLFQMVNVGTKREFQTAMNELREKGHWKTAYTAQQLMLEFWRKRVQNYKRIITGGSIAIEQFKLAVDGKRPMLTQAQILRIKESEDDPQKLSEILAPAKSSKGSKTSKGWARQKMLNYRKICQSPILCEVFDVLLGEISTEMAEVEKKIAALET